MIIMRIRLLKLFVLQGTELTNLRQKLAQYSDYDEIKRELDIMKVCPLIDHVLCAEAKSGCFT